MYVLYIFNVKFFEKRKHFSCTLILNSLSIVLKSTGGMLSLNDIYACIYSQEVN
jgi:hypothetical protein